MNWHMQMVTSRDDETHKDFESFEDGVAWLEEHEPGMLTGYKRLDRDHWKHFGTDYYWATFVRAPATL